MGESVFKRNGTFFVSRKSLLFMIKTIGYSKRVLLEVSALLDPLVGGMARQTDVSILLSTAQPCVDTVTGLSADPAYQALKVCQHGSVQTENRHFLGLMNQSQFL